MPKRLAVPGMVIAGDAASMVNVPTLKGIHYSMHAGIYAAESGEILFEGEPVTIHGDVPSSAIIGA